MKTSQEKTYKVLLEQLTPVYTMVTVKAKNKEEATAKAEGKADEEGIEWSHDRLPGDRVWSFIPPVDIFMPTEDEPPRVVGVCIGEVDTTLACLGSATVTAHEIVVPHFAAQVTDPGYVEDIRLDGPIDPWVRTK